MAALIGTELLQVLPIATTGAPSAGTEWVTTQAIANLASGGAGVGSINTLTGAITLAAGTNVTLGTVGNTITVNSTGGGGTPGGSSGQLQGNNASAFGGVPNSTINFTTGATQLMSAVIAVTGTSKTLALTDANTVQDCVNASTQTITIPANASVAFPTNTIIQFEQNGAGGVTIQAAGGVTLNGNVAGSASISTQYSSFYIRKEAADTWFAEGIPAGGGGSSAFNAITSGTNTTAAMVVGTGGSLAASGSGTIVATSAAAGSITGAMLSGTGAVRAFGFTKDGGGSVLSTGAVTGSITVPVTGTITKWYLSADVSGSIVVDVKRSGSTIVGAGNKPTLSGAISGNAAVSGWTSVAVTAGDIFTFNIDSITTITNITLVLSFNVT